MRRTLLAALGAGTLAHTLTGSLPALAQQPGKIWRVGVLADTGPQSVPGLALQRGLRQGLREAGYAEGKNLVIEWRFADLDAERLKGSADELVRLKVDVIVAGNTTATHAALKATTTLSIVMAQSGDPVGSGFAKSLAKPGGNVTGLSNISPEIGAKMLEMLLEITAAKAPRLSRVAVLINPDNSSNRLMLQHIQAAVGITRSKIIPLEARTAAALATAFATLTRERGEALIVARDSLFAQQALELATRTAQLRLPAAAGNRDFSEAGGLMSFGPKRTDWYRRVAMYVDRIFKGAKPADMPIEQPTLFELLINGKTARTLGLKIPHSLLLRADRVIE